MRLPSQFSHTCEIWEHYFF